MTQQKQRTLKNQGSIKAKKYNEEGLRHYERWEIEDAIRCFEQAAKMDADNPDYYLNLARARARFGDYKGALEALGEFMRWEPDSPLARRFERLFARSMDEVEKILTATMTASGLPLEEIGAAVQMWLEFRIALGRRPLSMRSPEAWAAALDYAIRKVNVREVTQKEIAQLYGVSETTLRRRFNELVKTLDIMPCDYRYFRGEKNPLDKLVEAAEMMRELEERFRRP